ncbi:MAG: hypothetical protein ACOVOJ_02915 [Pirellula sp.]
MKRTTLAVAALALAFTGCNTCGTWKPSLLGKFKSCLHGASNIGAPCDAGCESGAPATEGCQGCSESANYGGYGETVIGSYETPMSTGFSSSTDGISIGSPAASSSSILPGTSMPSTSRSVIPGETIRPKPAN